MNTKLIIGLGVVVGGGVLYYFLTQKKGGLTPIVNGGSALPIGSKTLTSGGSVAPANPITTTAINMGNVDTVLGSAVQLTENDRMAKALLPTLIDADDKLKQCLAQYSSNAFAFKLTFCRFLSNKLEALKTDLKSYGYVYNDGQIQKLLI